LDAEQLHFISDLLSKFLYPLQDGSKFDLEGFRCAFGQSHSTMRAVIFFGADQKIDDLGVEPCYDCFQSFSIAIDVLIIFASGNAIDYIGKSCA
jgi:hypothetical protein